MSFYDYTFSSPKWSSDYSASSESTHRSPCSLTTQLHSLFFEQSWFHSALSLESLPLLMSLLLVALMGLPCCCCLSEDEYSRFIPRSCCTVLLKKSLQLNTKYRKGRIYLCMCYCHCRSNSFASYFPLLTTVHLS